MVIQSRRPTSWQRFSQITIQISISSLNRTYYPLNVDQYWTVIYSYLLRSRPKKLRAYRSSTSPKLIISRTNHQMHYYITLRWRHNDRDCVSNHQPHYCLLKSLFGRTSTKTSKLRVTGLCEGNSPEAGEFPAQMASNAENVSIWWRHYEIIEYSFRTTIGLVIKNEYQSAIWSKLFRISFVQITFYCSRDEFHVFFDV